MGWRVANIQISNTITFNSFEPPTALNHGGILFNKTYGGNKQCLLYWLIMHTMVK